jgi:hypothetical protein
LKVSFSIFHRARPQAASSATLSVEIGRSVARLLLLHMLEPLLPNGPVVIGIDDTIERRWGARIKARGVYRDPVRSSKGHFVKTSGLRWLSLMVVVSIRWSGRHWALPFLTILAQSARCSETHRKRHKTLTDWALPAPRSGTMPASHRCRSAGCWCAIRSESTSRQRSLAPTRMRHPR